MTTDIATPLQSAILEAVGNKNRKPRKCRYSQEEIIVLAKYKDEYRNKTKTSDRHELIRSYILVDIFNFWFSKGIVGEEVTAEDLSERVSV